MNYKKQTHIKDPHQEQRELAAECLPEIKDFIMNEMNCTVSILLLIRRSKYLIDKCLSMTDKFLPAWAYWWALYIGNRDIMVNLVTDSEHAYYWAKNIGDRDVMVSRVIESKWAYKWGMYIGDRDIMKSRIRNSEYAYRWAINLGNKDIMLKRIKSLKWIEEWNKYVKNSG